MPIVVAPACIEYVSLAQIRDTPDLVSTTTFPDAKLVAARTWFETTFERVTGVAWVPRNVTETLDGAGRANLYLKHLFPRRITALSVRSDAGVTTLYTAAELADLRLSETGEVRRMSLGTFPQAPANIVVDYEHYITVCPPQDVVDAALVAIRDRLLASKTGNRVFATVDSAGNFARISTPGPGHPFGIQFVDEVALSRNYTVPGIA